MKTCNVWPARANTVFSRQLTVSAITGLILTDADQMDGIRLPRSGRTIGYEVNIRNRPTATGGTAANLVFQLTPSITLAQTITAMAAGLTGEMLSPGEATIISIPADQERLNMAFVMLQDDWSTLIEGVFMLNIYEMWALEGTVDCVQPGPCRL